MANAGDGLYYFDVSQNHDQQYPPPPHTHAHSHSHQHSNHQSQQNQHHMSWPVPSSSQQPPQNMTSTSSGVNMHAYKRSSSPLPVSMVGQAVYPDVAADSSQLMPTWPMSAPNHMPTVALGPIDTTSAFQQTTFDSYGASFQTSPQEFIAPQQTSYIQEDNVDQTAYDSLNLGLEVNPGLPFDSAAMNFQTNLSNLPDVQAMNINWPEVHESLAANYMRPHHPVLHPFNQGFSLESPSEDSFEIGSCTSSENSGWGMMQQAQPLAQTGYIQNPEQALHPRTWSDSSSDKEQQQGSTSWDEGYINIPSGGLDSPSSESGSHSSENSFYMVQKSQPSPPQLTATSVQPIAMRRQNSQRKSPTSPTSARNVRFSKTPIVKPNASSSKATTAAVKRAVGAPAGKEDNKRVGRRKGPLSADQRKQASEIRKLGACIRCRFLKKTCDKGEPCAGCQPSHARLWLVPCTRVDIKDLGYFLKGWKADYERHVTCAVSVSNVKGFSDQEECLFITHGYGHYLPIKAREVFVRDESVFLVDWVESHSGSMQEFVKKTARLSAGADGISPALLHEYLDHHVDSGFEYFVDEHFQGTPFVTELLKIAFRFYIKEKTPVLRNALKFVLAYNLTQSICLIKGIPYEEENGGAIDDLRSEFNGQTVAPMMINFQVKTAMAELWRELQASLLQDLSQLYSSIYSKDKLKNWPTIFMLASLLLVVWEEMQFDSRYRQQDEKLSDKFCHDMESTPVGVIVGLFSAISQKVPAFSEWDTAKHHTLLGSNPNVCEAMEEVCTGVQKFDKYLRARQANKVKFDRNDFDCLSNMFVSKLVIKSH